MSYDTLENLVRKALSYDTNNVVFAFQGGEPTLAGLEFFKEFIRLEKKYNINHIKVSHALQTNGIVIDEDWAKFLHDNTFLIGLFLDGYKEIHDLNRIDSNNQGSFRKAMESTILLDKFKVEYNILVVVNVVTVRHANKIYKFFKKTTSDISNLFLALIH